jgi:hypothetical protein
MEDTPQTRTILNPDVDRCRITVSTPSLQKIESDGDVKGSKVKFKVECEDDGGGFELIGEYTIEGKTNSRYQRSVMFLLPRKGPWDIRVTRLTEDSDSVKLQNDLYWDSYTEIIDDRVNYTNSAVVGIMIDAEQFSSIPKRSYLTDGLLCLIPSNYDPDTAIYTGVWDGTFDFEWTNNPAWVLYDILVNNRYGLGEYVTPAMVNKWEFYKVARWCDELVPDGNGGEQRRYTCNAQLMERQEAFDLLGALASIFRGFIYWSGGQVISVADMPSDPVMQFTNANVVDGQFTYSGTDIRARHTVATVQWNDPKFLGEQRLAVVENQELISRFGIQRVEIPAIGCTNEGQAIRTGKWSLYTEAYESETIQFSTGLESAWCRPGDIIRVLDHNIAGKRRGGRVGAGSTAGVIVFDQPMDDDVLAGGSGTFLSCIIGEGDVQTREIFSVDSSGAFCTLLTPFTAAPLPDTVFVINQTDELEPTLWRVLGARQIQQDQYELSAVRHFPGKWDYIEQEIALTIPDSSAIQRIPPAVTGLEIIEYLQQLSPISVGVRATVSWISTSPLFEVQYRRAEDNWHLITTDQNAIDLDVTEDAWEFKVTPISMLGFKGPTSDVSIEIIGRFSQPAAPQLFRVNVVDSVALFDWLPATELDVIIGGHYELRHSSTVEGAIWQTAQVVIPSIPGSATSCEAGYQAGTWFLRTFDILGIPSEEYSIIIALLPDERYVRFVTFCENPDWEGTHDDTAIRMPQNWLTIDDAAMVPGEASEGTYELATVLDAGAPFSVRLSADILAFNYAIPDDWIDSRLDNCDLWEDWDNAGANYAGEITLLISETMEDPAGASPLWTPWERFIAGEHFGRGFRFRALLTAPAGQNIGIETLCINADLKAKIDEGADVDYPAADTRVEFRAQFFVAPAVVVTVQNAMEADRVQIIAKTTEYFDIRITGSPDGVTQKVRTFDWHAQGYGYILGAAGLGGLLQWVHTLFTASWTVI